MLFFKSRRNASNSRELADKARDAKEWAVAAGYYRAVLEQEPDHAALWVQLGHALKESGSLTGAEAAYRKSIEIEPENADAHLQLGHALKIQGRIKDAVAAYLQAIVLAPTMPWAFTELRALGCPPERIGQALRGHAGSEDEAQSDDQPSSAVLVFELADLIEFVEKSRAPTGVQRVQLRMVTGLLRRQERGFDIALVVCVPQRDCWVRIPEDVFLSLANLLLAGGRSEDPVWLATLRALEVLIATAKPFAFRQGATLLALGPTWSIPDYFLKLRLAKERFAIRYVQFFHDTIPYSVPDLVPKLQTCQFIGWVASLLSHADRMLTNSRASATDLTRMAAKLGHRIDEPRIIALDGQFAALATSGQQNGPSPIIQRYDLDRQSFVLFVATIEARKNHLATFEVWLAMIRKRGLLRVPLLVCIGKRGWMAEGALAFLEASDLLKKKVVIVSHVGDDELAELYERCLFTVFPSLYEGWGLPVTEALCHGKVPLVAATSSLPEAGGKWAEYFDPLSQREMLEKLDRLIDDKVYREQREATIRNSFHPRSWDEITDEFVHDLFPDLTTPLAAEGGRLIWAPEAMPCHYYAMALTTATEVWPGVISGEMYRDGSGWWPLESWGTWMGREVAEIAFSVPKPTRQGGYVLYLGLRGLPGTPAVPEPEVDYQVRVLGTGSEERGSLRRDEHRWVLLAIPSETVHDGSVRVRLVSSGNCEFGDAPYVSKIVTLGILGFYFCKADDLIGRLRFFEALQLNRLQTLNGRPGAPGSSKWSGAGTPEGSGQSVMEQPAPPASYRSGEYIE